MRQFYTLTFTVVLLITTMFTQAQSVLSSKVPSNNFFTNVTKSGLDTKTRKAIMQTPQMMKVKETLKSYQLYSIDESSLKKYLKQAPVEGNAAQKTLDVQIPLPDGTVETFAIVNSQVLSPALAKQFSFIKTYNGYGKKRKDITIHITVTNSGFNAIVIGGDNDFYIEKQSSSKTGVANYISYYVKDVVTPKNYQKTNNSCGDKSHTMLHVDPNTPVKSLLDFQRSAKPGKGLFGSDATVPLRTFRLAISATGEYTNTFAGTTSEQKQLAAFEFIVAQVNRMCAVYKTDLGVTFQLVSGTNTILTNTTTLTNSDQSAMLDQNQTLMDNTIGNANYDVAHAFTFDGVGTSGGGIAQSPAICNDGSKARGVSGTGGDPWVQLFFDQTFFHETGHQFGMSHTYNSNIPVCTTRSQPTSAEPGSGATIMSYGFTCQTDDYIQSTTTGPILHFHILNINQALSTIASNSCYVVSSSSNIAPVITDISKAAIIPKSTPFYLTASATDANNDNLTYAWEGKNVGLIAAPVAGDIDNTAIPPYSRSYEATATANTRVFPILSSILDGTNQAKGDKLPSIATTLTYGLTVRDNNTQVGGITMSDVVLTVDANAGPFLITNDLTGTLPANSSQTINWSVNNTDGTNGSTVNVPNVKVSLSTDGGQTFGTVLLESTPNTGSASVTLPNVTTKNARIKVEAIGNIFFDISNSDFTITNGATPVNTWTGAVSTDWTTVGNWSNNVLPTAKDDVIIPSGTTNAPSVSGTQSTKSITVNSGATVTISGTLQVNGNITNNGTITGTGLVDVIGTNAATISGSGTISNLSLENTGGTSISAGSGNKLSITGLLTLNAALQTNNNLVIISTASQSGMIKDDGSALSGKAYIQHYAGGKFGYHHFSSPIKDGTVTSWANALPIFGADGVVALGSKVGSIQLYDEAANTTSLLDSSYYNYVTLTNELTPGKGYTSWLNSLPTLNTLGTPNNGTVSIPVTHSAGTNAPKGWNLVGNPYPSPISWTALKNLNPGLFGDNSCYLWQSNGVGTNGNWVTYNGTVGTNGGGDVINSSLGFFVYVNNSGTLNFDNTVRTYSFNSPEVFGTKSEPVNTLRISINEPNAISKDEAVAYTSNQPSFSRKMALPATATNPTIAFDVKGTKAAINVVTSIDSKTELPITVLTPIVGTYSLNLNTKNINLPVYLKDAVTGIFTDLKANSTVSVTTTTKETSGRFSLVFTTPTVDRLQLTVSPNPAKDVVTVKGNHVASVQVVDNLGRVIKTVSLKDATNPTISVNGLSAGAYHLRVQTTDGKVNSVGLIKE